MLFSFLFFSLSFCLSGTFERLSRIDSDAFRLTSFLITRKMPWNQLLYHMKFFPEFSSVPAGQPSLPTDLDTRRNREKSALSQKINLPSQTCRSLSLQMDETTQMALQI